MKNPFFKKVKAIEAKQKEPNIYIFSEPQVWSFGLGCVLGGIIIVMVIALLVIYITH